MATDLPASYAELYDSLPDMLGGEYAAFMAPFSAESGEQPADLRDAVFNATNDVPKVFLYCTEDPPVIQVMHRATK